MDIKTALTEAVEFQSEITHALRNIITDNFDTKVAFIARLNVLDDVRFIISRTQDNLHNSVHDTMREYFKKTPTK